MKWLRVFLHPLRTRDELLTLRQQLAERDSEQSALKAESETLRRRITELEKELEAVRAEHAEQQAKAEAASAVHAQNLKATQDHVASLSAQLAEKEAEIAEQEKLMEKIGSQAEQLIAVHQRYEKRIAMLRRRLEEAKRQSSTRRSEDGIAELSRPTRDFYSRPISPATATSGKHPHTKPDTPQQRPISPEDRPADDPADHWYTPLDL